MTFTKDVFFLNNTSLSPAMGLCVFNERTGVIDFNGSTYFHNNQATNAADYGQGMAIYNEGILSLNGYSEFINNGAISKSIGATGSVMGGAIRNYPGGRLNINATALFIGNYIDEGYYGLANGYGGAISNNGELNFNLTRQGDYVLFQGNRDTTGANAIYHTTGNLNFNHVMGTDVYFYDPISNGTVGYYARVNQNSCGTVHFIGAGNRSDYSAFTNINKGYFQLEEGAVFGSRGTVVNNIFSVGQNGSLSGDGTFRANEIHIDGTLLPGFYMDKGYYFYCVN